MQNGGATGGTAVGDERAALLGAALAGGGSSNDALVDLIASYSNTEAQVREVYASLTHLPTTVL